MLNEWIELIGFLIKFILIIFMIMIAIHFLKNTR